MGIMTSLKGRPRATTLPATLEAHPSWQKHEQQCADLTRSLSAAQDALAQLVAERDRLAVDRQEQDVRALLGDVVPALQSAEQMAGRLRDLESEITQATTRVGTVREALRRLEARGAEVREAITAELRGQIQEIGKDVIVRMGNVMAALMAVNLELRNLERFDVVTLPVSSWQELAPEEWSRAAQWLAQARAAGLEV